MTRTFDPADRHNTPFDTAVEALLALLLAFLPLAFGATEYWSQEIGLALVAAMGLAVLLKRATYGTASSGAAAAFVPIVVFVVLLLAQWCPLPAAVVRAISPASVSLRDELLVPVGAKTTLSLYPLATLRQARLVAAAAVLFWVVVVTYRTPALVRRLLVTVTGVGLLVASYALVADVLRATTIFGLVAVGHPNSGPFQNHSHFSQFINLSIGAAVALLLSAKAEWTEHRYRPAEVWVECRRPESGPLWAAAALCVLGPLVVLLSLSRMGVLTTFVAAAACAALLGVRPGAHSAGRGGRAFVIVALGLAVTAGLLAFGFDAVYARLGTLGRSDDTSTAVRWQIVRKLAGVWTRFPLFGTGLGTHEFVFPAFSRLPAGVLFTHAENEYAQLAEEAGAAGVLLAAAFVVAVVVSFVKVLRRPDRAAAGTAIGLGFGLVAVGLHSISDFGQHVPANAALTAVCCGLVVAAGATHRPTIRSPFVRGRAGAAAVAFAVATAVLLWDADLDRRAAAAWDAYAAATSDALDAGAAGTDAHFAYAITAAAAAADLRPGDVVYQTRLAKLRWQLVARDTADAAAGTTELPAEAVAFVRQIVVDLDAARSLCPTYGPPLGLAGQLRDTVLGDPAGTARIRLAYRLTPYDRGLCRLVGRLDLRDGDWPAAAAAFARFRAIGGPVWQIVDAYLEANRPDLARQAAAGDRDNLLRLADGLAAWPGQAAVAEACRGEAERLLVTRSDAADATPAVVFERGVSAERAGDVAASIAWYQKAVDADYGRIEWRLALARAQAADGRRDEAVQNLRICLRLRPDSAEARRLLSDSGGASSAVP